MLTYKMCYITNNMNEIKKVLGKKIKEAREEMGITQKELGALLGYSPMGISHFENGIRDLKTSDIQKMVEYFNKPMSFFLSSNMTLFRADNSASDEIEKVMTDFDSFLNKKGY